MNIQKYTTVATAKRGVVRAGVPAEIAKQFVKTDNGEVSVDLDAVKAWVAENGKAETAPEPMTPEDQELFNLCGHVHCPDPDCGIHLSNGLSDFEGIVDRTETLAEALQAQGRQWACLGCGHEFGDEIDAEAVKAANKAAVRHYTGKSSVEDPCELVHQLFKEMPGARRKDVIQAAVDAGVAFYTARTQYQKAFKANKSAKGLAKA